MVEKVSSVSIPPEAMGQTCIWEQAFAKQVITHTLNLTPLTLTLSATILATTPSPSPPPLTLHPSPLAPLSSLTLSPFTIHHSLSSSPFTLTLTFNQVTTGLHKFFLFVGAPMRVCVHACMHAPRPASPLLQVQLNSEHSSLITHLLSLICLGPLCR